MAEQKRVLDRLIASYRVYVERGRTAIEQSIEHVTEVQRRMKEASDQLEREQEEQRQRESGP